MMESLIFPVLAVILAPLFLGIINRVKAIFAGRKGQPLLQLYFDIFKLLQKGVVYSRTTTWIFRAGPIVTMAATLCALMFIPTYNSRSVLAFSGDIVLFAYLFGLARFFTIAAALDTGSSFEGMGSSREAFFSALSEPILFISFATLARITGSFSLSGIVAGLSSAVWTGFLPSLIITAAALYVVILTENSRIPVDDPNTHLELTMIHEVMVLDHGGVDFAFIQYAASLKIFVLSALAANLVVPFRTGVPLADMGILLISIFSIAILVGITESTMARFRMTQVPQFLLGAFAVSTLSFLLSLR